jgi:hypothetical protein
MASDISPTTGEQFYSGSWTDIQSILRVLDIGEGKMSKVTQVLVNGHQEVIDREMDAVLSEVHQTPIRATNQVQPDGTTKRVFPGDLKNAAMYWTAGRILLTEFQQLEANVTEQAQTWIADAKQKVYAMASFTHRIPGQRRKSNVSRTMPSNIQPPRFLEDMP